jgi:hypothetical protein
MMASTKAPAERQPETAADMPPDGAERRRPGRPENVSPALIPLLRREHLLQPQTAPGAAASGDSRDDLAPARGVAVSVAIGALLWLAMVGAAWWLFVP